MSPESKAKCYIVELREQNLEARQPVFAVNTSYDVPSTVLTLSVRPDLMFQALVRKRLTSLSILFSATGSPNLLPRRIWA